MRWKVCATNGPMATTVLKIEASVPPTGLPDHGSRGSVSPMRANCHFVRLGGPSCLPANAHPRGEVLSPPTKKQLKKISKFQNPKLGGSALGMQLMLRQQDLWEEHCPGSHGISASSPCGTLRDTRPLSWSWPPYTWTDGTSCNS